MSRVSVCICTYRRPERLGQLLQDLSQQTRLPEQVVVVDNDAAASARNVVESLRAPFALRYDIQPEKNIALTRNRTVALADGDWLAFLDDDQRAGPSWLAELLQAAKRYQADGVLGNVVYSIPDGAPEWIKQGRFYLHPSQPSGTWVETKDMCMGNVLLCATAVKALPGPFDPAFGLTGGEDSDMMARLAAHSGHRMVWSQEAFVTEPVEPARLNLRWLLLRSISGGNDYATHLRNGRYGRWRARLLPLYLLRWTLQAMAGLLLSVLTWPLGKQHSVWWLRKAALNFGKLSAIAGWRYREYAKPKPAAP